MSEPAPRARLFDSRLTRRQRRIYGAVIAWFAAAFAAMTWPFYTLASRPRPLLFGMPLSLAYLAAILVLSFGVLLALFAWEGRRVEAPPP